MLPGFIHEGVEFYVDPVMDMGGTSSMPAPVHAPPALMRYDLPLTPTMWKLVEACDFVDQLKAQKLRNERLANAKTRTGELLAGGHSSPYRHFLESIRRERAHAP